MTVNRGVVCRRLGPDGRGVGEVDGVEVSAADWLPGEVADLAIEHRSPHRPLAWARVVERSGPDSADRVEPACPAFGRCGGCRLQHLSPDAQLRLKRDRVIDALAGAGLEAVEVAAVVAAPEPLGYRNRGKYVLSDARGEVVIGAYEPRSNRVVSTLGCRVVEPAIDRAAVALREAVERSGVSLRYAIIRSGADGRVAVCAITRSGVDRSAIEAVAADLIDAGVAGVSWAVNDRSDGGLLAAAPQPIAGDVEVLERAVGIELRLPIAAFAQVNRAQAARLVDRLIERLALPEGGSVLDAYAGAGAIAIALARSGARVTAVELEPSAVAAGRAAIEAAGLAVGFDAGDAAGALAGQFDAVVVNPPRKGLDSAARAALIAGGNPRIAYVSCGPESLARDLAALASAGYRIDRVEPFDLMPGTPEIETLTLLFK